MKQLLIVFFISVFACSCAHDTYAFSNLSSCGADQKPFKAVKPTKRKVY